jgi:chaperonin GroEL (HSP60 family)
MAIKGALREGVLPGCGKTLLTLAQGVRSHPGLSEAVKTILGGALSAPFARIFENGEIHKDEIQQIYEEMMEKSKPLFYTYDALNNKYGDGIELGVIDSASAVLMSVKNSLSVAKMLMGLSGIVVFQRDLETEVGESKSFAAQQKAIDEAIKARDNEKWEQPGF